MREGEGDRVREGEKEEGERKGVWVRGGGEREIEWEGERKKDRMREGKGERYKDSGRGK